MRRAVQSLARALLQGTQNGRSAVAAAAEAIGSSSAALRPSPWRAPFNTAAQASARTQGLVPQLPSLAAGSAAAAAAAAAVRAAGSSGGGAWRTVGAAAGRQQVRNYARFLQFPQRNRSWSGGSWGGSWDSDKVLYALIGANVAGFVLWRVSPRAMTKHGMVSIESLRSGRVWTAVTAAFSHIDLMHLGANMLGLYFFGRDVGRMFGGKKLLLLYLAGGVAGSLAHCGYYFFKSCQTGEGRYGRARWFGFTPPALGASAAINAITVVDILLFPSRTVLLYGIIPMPAFLLGALWLWRDVSGAYDGSQSKTAHAGHLGGAAVGLLFYLAYRRGLIRPRGWY